MKINKRLEFNECLKKRFLIKTLNKNIDKAQELIKLSEHRLEFWNKVSKKENNFPSLFIEGHYEIVKELISALLFIEGWKSLNHECLFAYLSKFHKDLEIDLDFLTQLKDLRNAIDYRGIMIKKERWLENKLKILITINTLIKYIKEKIK